VIRWPRLVKSGNLRLICSACLAGVGRSLEAQFSVTSSRFAVGLMAMTTVISEKCAQVYTPGELMVVSAAREIRDGEVVFVGMRLPLIAFVVAKKTHAPNAVGLFENGVIRSTPSPELIYAMADPANIKNATQCLDMLGVMRLLQSGRVQLGFLGAAEVDRFGNLNSTEVQGAKGMTRLPGSGGACDIASLAHRFVALLEHSRERLPERVSYVTRPGNGNGRGWRQRVGLTRGGPAAVITSKAVLQFGDDGEAYLSSTHPGVEVEDVLRNTGWTLRVSDEVTSTPEPSAEELKAIREYDKDGFWTK
jgi:glutaconate CoA-transferase, subunit B